MKNTILFIKNQLCRQRSIFAREIQYICLISIIHCEQDPRHTASEQLLVCDNANKTVGRLIVAASKNGNNENIFQSCQLHNWNESLQYVRFELLIHRFIKHVLLIQLTLYVARHQLA